jgi:AcrR family transcriptional regulator
MTGLRARQKLDRTKRILKAASTLFRKTGYDSARIEEIAAAADVSVGTIYNYYANKGDLLVAIVAMEVNDVITSGEAVVEKPPSSALKAVNALMTIYIEHSLVWLNKHMWRQAMGTAMQQPQSPFGHSYADLDDGLADQMTRLITKLQKLRIISPKADPQTLGEVIFNNMDRMFIGFVKVEGGSVKQLLKAIARQNKVIIAPYALK